MEVGLHSSASLTLTLKKELGGGGGQNPKGCVALSGIGSDVIDDIDSFRYILYHPIIIVATIATAIKRVYISVFLDSFLG